MLENTSKLANAVPDEENIKLFAQELPRLALLIHAGSQ